MTIFTQVTIRRSLLISLLASTATVGCSSAPQAGPERTSQSSSALLGDVTFDNSAGSDCGPEQDFIRGAIAFGRAIATSNVFEQCVSSVMNGQSVALGGDIHSGRFLGSRTAIGPYDVCTNDPTPPNPAISVIESTRSPLGIHITCSDSTSGGEVAHATVTTDPGPNESLTYLEPRLIPSVTSQDPQFVAGTIWHEAMHQHGWVHGNGRAEDCGYSSSQFPDDDSSWFVAHTVPYVVDACMVYIGDISAGCTQSCPTGYALRTALDPNSDCYCQRDPRSRMQTNVSPAVATTPDGVLFFSTDTDGRIYQNRTVLGQAGQGWIELEGGGRTDAAPAAALVGNNPYVFVAVKGLDGNVYLNQGGLGGPYVGWQTDASLQTDRAPGAASTPDGVMLFAKDLSGRIFSNRIVLGQAGHGWTEMNAGGRTDAAPAAAIAGNAAYMFVAVKGLDGNVYINQGDVGGPWVGWQTDGAIQTNVAPAVATTPDGVVFFATRTDGRIFANRVVLGQAGQGWVELDGSGQTDAGPAAAAVGNAPYLFAAIKGLDGNYYINQGGVGGPWVGWQ